MCYAQEEGVQMLAVFGANGMTGIEVVREALRNNIPVRPIVRDDLTPTDWISCKAVYR